MNINNSKIICPYDVTDFEIIKKMLDPKGKFIFEDFERSMQGKKLLKSVKDNVRKKATSTFVAIHCHYEAMINLKKSNSFSIKTTIKSGFGLFVIYPRGAISLTNDSGWEIRLPARKKTNYHVCINNGIAKIHMTDKTTNQQPLGLITLSRLCCGYVWYCPSKNKLTGMPAI